MATFKGAVGFDKQLFTSVYFEHLEDVTAYFHHRYGLKVDQKVLWFDVEDSDGWPELCAFTGNEIPDVPFPWEGAR